ncbi:MAG TPA: SDR family NAD(P)-dependent oxidoreductase [Acidimicrobiales bacterium]|nr:SDR family NAD(P)-dependent oxidoreductase [Acidimicrobiales bacterium]
MKLDGAVAVVTGASHGIGLAAATALHGRGAAVGLLARSEDELRAAVAALGPKAAYALADVAERDQVDQALAQLTDTLGPPDVLVNNAGIGAYAPMLEEDPEIFERLVRVNYLGTVYATLAVLPGMAARRRGHIVNVASVAGRLGAPFEAAYSGSKFAVVGLTEALAAEVHPLGIRVSMVNPGPVHTRFAEARGVPFQRAVPRPLPPERVADAVVKAVVHDRFEQTIPRWLRVGSITRALAPNLYRRGLVRTSSTEAHALARRLEVTP